jgi:demethoxyubiquinone hydroxylase (CLK1/Coq7/Cat5 family)
VTRPGAPEQGLFGDEGDHVLADRQTWLMPATARPAFLRWLWATLLALGVAAGLVGAMIAGIPR